MSPDLYRLEQKLSIGVSLEEVAFFFFFLPHYRTLPVGPEDYRLMSLEGPIQSILTSK